MKPARIAALRYQTASEAVADCELASLLGIDPVAVADYSRNRSRYFAPDGVGPADLAAQAATVALKASGVEAAEIDLILFATNTPDLVFPGSSCFLQRHFDCDVVPCMDIRAQCTGFLVALDIASRFVATGAYARVLVACGEVPSHQNRFDGSDPALACLTSDGAAVAIVVEGEGTGRVLATRIRGDGRFHRDFWCEYPSSRHRERTGVARGQRVTRWMVEEGRIFPAFDPARLRATALREVPPLFGEVLNAAGLNAVDATIVAHPDPQTETEMAKCLGPQAGRVYLPDLLYAYSAALPTALGRSLESGLIGAGETVALVTAGGGASWGATVLGI